MSSSLIENYKNLVKTKEILSNPYQLEIIEKLDNLKNILEKNSKRFFKQKLSNNGYYIYGDVGRGKSFIMDLFFSQINIAKKRIHFHEFMTDIHNQLHLLRQSNPDITHPLWKIAKEFSKKYKLLCFDEFQVTDIADAMILERLFRALFKYKVIIITTSNRHPNSLYEGGIQREKYLEFVNYLAEQMEVFELKGKTDYRHQLIGELKETYIFPKNKKNDKKINDLFEKLTCHSEISEHIITNKKREIKIKKAASNTCELDFNEFCANHYGTSDYQLIAKNFKTIFLTNIKTLNPEETDILKRFINLIDILYEHKTDVIFYASCPPTEIYKSGKKSFEFKRTLSRINEMQSKNY